LQNIKISLSVFLVVFSTLALAGAYVSQYVFGMEPCILCLYQRVPYFIVIIIASISYFMHGRSQIILWALCGIVLLAGALIAFYHVGVEQGVFKISDGCEVGNAMPSSLEEMTMQLMGKPNVPCDKPQFVFLGLSMAAWNFLFSASIGFITCNIVWKLYETQKLIKKSDEHNKKRKEGK